MPQLGPIDLTVQETDGDVSVGAAVNIYREGALVNGNQSGVAPLVVTVRHQGKISAGDTVFIGNDSATTYSVTAASLTSLTLSGFAGTLSLTNLQRIVPSNSQPTIYSDDQAGASVAQPLTTDSLGSIATSGGLTPLWMEGGAYHALVTPAGGTARLYQVIVIAGEAPSVVYSGERDGATAVAHVEDTRFSMATAGALLKEGRNAGTRKYAIDKDGTAIFPRLGQSSSGTTGGAIRVVEGSVFPLTVAGVQAALDEVETAGGGTVWVPANAGILIGTVSIKVPNRVSLRSFADHTSTYTFTCDANTNVSAGIENKTQDGTQQYAYLEGISFNGNKASGAIVGRGINMKAVYVGTRLKDILVVNCSGNGIVIDGSLAAVGAGQLMWDNITVTGCNDDNILITGPVDSVYGFQTTSESVAAGKAMMRITNATATASRGHCFVGVHMEGTNASDGVVLDGCSNVYMNNVVWDGGAAQLNVIKITGTVAGSDGAFAAGGHTFHNVSGNLTTIIDDQVAGVTVGNAQGRFVQFYVSPAHVQSGGNDLAHAQIVGLQQQKQGINITAASTISPTEGNYFVVDGNTNIDNITNAAIYKGKVLYLEFTGTPTLVHNSGGNGNLRLVGSANVAMTAGDVIQLVSNGTLWRQCAPVVVI